MGFDICKLAFMPKDTVRVELTEELFQSANHVASFEKRVPIEEVLSKVSGSCEMKAHFTQLV